MHSKQHKYQILIPDRVAESVEIERAVFGEKAEFVLGHAAHANEIPDSVWETSDAILAWHELDYDESLLSKLHCCKTIVRVGVGYDNVDLKSAGQRGIVVCNVPDYGTGEVADHALAMLLSFARGIPGIAEKVRQSNEFWSWKKVGNLKRLSDSVLGIIGLGRIGSAVALRAKSFGLRVLFYDPYKPAGYDKTLGIERFHDLHKMLEAVDYVSLHAPLTDETRGMADQRFFAHLKPGAVLINTARGAIVEMDALERTLRVGRLKAAGLDVLPEEPPDRSHPLMKAWTNDESWLAGRLLVTPHSAFWCVEALTEMRRKAAEEALRVLEGGEPLNPVNAYLFSKENKPAATHHI
ncbi:C-terminal binding protein [bacterium]|nr:C-terminal binding protein [bacterium]